MRDLKIAERKDGSNLLIAESHSMESVALAVMCPLPHPLSG